MSRITVGAQVQCTEGACGELTALVIDPNKRTVTHYVVRASSDKVERMLPADRVVSSTPTTLTVNCTPAELNGMEQFVKDELVAANVPDPHDMAYTYYYGYGYGIPDVVPSDPQYMHIQSDRVPEGERELREGTPVQARDGRVGTVKALVTNDEGIITHFVVDEGGRVGGHSDLTLPLAAIDYTDDEGVHLKLDKNAVHSLPTIPANAAVERVQLVGKLFDSPTKAQEGLEWLQQAAKNPSKPLKIREAAVLVREADGTPRVVQSSQPSAAKGAAVGAAAGGLLALLGPIGLVAGAAIGGGVGAVAGSKMDKGFPDKFLERLEDHLQPGKSALVVLVEHDNAQDLTEALAGGEKVFGGQQIVDTLVQEMLLEAESTPAGG